jgi:hypothetical protein
MCQSPGNAAGLTKILGIPTKYLILALVLVSVLLTVFKSPSSPVYVRERKKGDLTCFTSCASQQRD